MDVDTTMKLFTEPTWKSYHMLSLLIETLESDRALPRSHFNMSRFFMQAGDGPGHDASSEQIVASIEQAHPVCGTACCIGGWFELLFPQEDNIEDIVRSASPELGQQADMLGLEREVWDTICLRWRNGRSHDEAIGKLFLVHQLMHAYLMAAFGRMTIEEDNWLFELRKRISERREKAAEKNRTVLDAT